MIRREAGQAAVELAALAPVLALAVLVFAQLAFAFRAELAAERAAGRAQAAAVLGLPVLVAARGGAPAGTRASLRAGVLELDVPSGLRLPLPQLAQVHLSRRLAVVSPRSERGAVAIAAVALLLVLALVAGAGLRAGRALLLDERVHGSADAVALAAASVLEGRYGAAVDAGGSPATTRATEAASRAAAERASARLGLELESISFERSARDPSPTAVRVRVVAGRDRAGARAGLAFAQPAPAQGFRPADVRGLDARRRGRRRGARAARLAVRVGRREQGGGRIRLLGAHRLRLRGGGSPRRAPDCGRAPAARPAAPGRRGAAGGRPRVRGRCRRITSASSWRPGWPSKRRTAVREFASSRSATAAGPAPDGCCCRVRASRTPASSQSLRTCPCPSAPSSRRPREPSRCRRRCWRRNSRPRAASTPRRARRPAPQGIAQFMPATWAGAWNPQRAHSPFEPGPAIAAQARLMHDLLERAGGDIATALAAYNAGPAVMPADWPRETRAYVARILRRFGGPARVEPAARCRPCSTPVPRPPEAERR